MKSRKLLKSYNSGIALLDDPLQRLADLVGGEEEVTQIKVRYFSAIEGESEKKRDVEKERE